MKIYLLILVLFVSPFSSLIFGQEGVESTSDSIEVFIIDSYIPPENTNKFILSFYTSEACKTKLVLENSLVLPISEELTDNHRIEVDLARINVKKNKANYVIQMENAEGVKSTSELFEIEFSRADELIESKSSYLFTCLAGGIVFLTPSITAVQANRKLISD